jgi:hypothetical protein
MVRGLMGNRLEKRTLGYLPKAKVRAIADGFILNILIYIKFI